MHQILGWKILGHVSRTLESEDVHLFKFRLRSVENQLLKNDPRSVHRVHTPVTFSLATNRQLNRLTHFFVSQCSASITVFCISCYEDVFHLSRSWNRTNRYRFPPAPGFVSSPKNIQFRANFVSVVFLLSIPQKPRIITVSLELLVVQLYPFVRI